MHQIRRLRTDRQPETHMHRQTDVHHTQPCLSWDRPGSPGVRRMDRGAPSHPSSGLFWGMRGEDEL